MQPYDAEIAKIKPAAAGKTYGATEGIFDYMAKALGLDERDPPGYQNATANESDPAPGDVQRLRAGARERNDRRADLQHPDRGRDPRAGPQPRPTTRKSRS